MHEQPELPGGALGDAITTLNQNERHWLRPATIGHDADPELKHTTVRWHTDPTLIRSIAKIRVDARPQFARVPLT